MKNKAKNRENGDKAINASLLQLFLILDYSRKILISAYIYRLMKNLTENLGQLIYHPLMR